MRRPQGLRSFPLLIFGHVVSPVRRPSTRVCCRAGRAPGSSWRAPVFPVENADAPGDPRRGRPDNQPGDMSLRDHQSMLARVRLALGRSRASSPPARSPSPVSRRRRHRSRGSHTTRLPRPAREGGGHPLRGRDARGRRYAFAAGEPAAACGAGHGRHRQPAGQAEDSSHARSSPGICWRLLAPNTCPLLDQEPQLSIVARVSTEFLRGISNTKPPICSASGSANVPEVSTLTSQPA